MPFNPAEFDKEEESRPSATSGFNPANFDEPGEKSMAWSDVPGQALSNAPHSAVEFGKAVAQPFIHPVETYENVRDLGHGILQKMGVMEGHDYEKHANAVGQFFADRYGGLENVKRTLAKDPVGTMADAATVLTGGGGLAARAPGVIGKVGEVAGAAGRIADPTLAAAKTVGLAGRGAAQVIGGLGTHTGPEAIELAAQAGREGGSAAESFKRHLQGTAPMEEAVDEALGAERNLRDQRNAAYKQDMAQIKAATPLGHTLLPFNNVDRALADAGHVGVSRTGRTIDPEAVAAHKKISDIVDQWRKDPVHTIEDMDDLKKAVGAVLKNQESNTAEKLISGKVYNAIKDEIVRADPRYAKAMNAYERATDQLDELHRTLSLNPNATIDTTLRKLQSTLRDNVNTSYGRRRELAQFLVKNGAPDLLYKLAGQTLKPWAPRGLGRFAMSIGMEVAGLMGGGMAAGPHGLAVAAAGAPFMSPRAMGVGAYHAGMASRYMPNLGAYQLGRLGRPDAAQFKKGGRVKRSFNWGI